MKAVIMAGGKGTRISPIFSDIPKPMIQICGKPVLEHEILCLEKQGIKDFIITVSYLKDIIINYFGNGYEWNVNIEWFVESEPLGNAGALFKIKDKLKEDFLLINGDIIFDVDIRRMVRFHRSHGGLATLYTHPNSHPFDSGLIITDEDNRVVKWLTKEDARPKYYKNRVNAGIHILSTRILENLIDSDKVDLDKQILKPLAETGMLYAYDCTEYVSDMGTPDRFKKVCHDFESNMVAAKSLLNRQKAFFLDRDGTINKYAGFLKNIDDFELIEYVPDAIRLINESDYLAIVVTNQPVIARGEMTIRQLDEIHNKMETLLGQKGAYLNAVYYCPHHPDGGYDGEVKSLKINCQCRKPKIGMLERAAREYNIDLKESWIIGDEERDVLTGKNAYCKTARILREDINGSTEADLTGNSLFDVINKILRK